MLRITASTYDNTLYRKSIVVSIAKKKAVVLLASLPEWSILKSIAKERSATYTPDDAPHYYKHKVYAKARKDARNRIAAKILSNIKNELSHILNAYCDEKNLQDDFLVESFILTQGQLVAELSYPKPIGDVSEKDFREAVWESITAALGEYESYLRKASTTDLLDYAEPKVIAEAWEIAAKAKEEIELVKVKETGKGKDKEKIYLPKEEVE